MPRPCSVCIHKSRAEIDGALTGGAPYRDVAGRWSLSKSAVERHAKEHIAKPLAAVGVSLAESRDRGRGTVPGPEYGAALLVDRARERSGIAMSLASRAQSLLGRAETFLGAFEAAADGGALDPEVAEAFAKVVAAMSSTLGSAVQALGGGAGKHDEFEGKLTGEFKPAQLNVLVAQHVDPKTGDFNEAARQKMLEEMRGALQRMADLAVTWLPEEEREAARADLWAAAKGKPALPPGGGN